MTVQSASGQTLVAPVSASGLAGTSARPWWSYWHDNIEFLLAVVTLLALLIGWLGANTLPAGAVIACALIAFGAGGYSGLMGAIAEARQGRFDIDFLMITAALGAAAIGNWQEGALLLFLFTLSGALENFAMERTRRAIPRWKIIEQGKSRCGGPGIFGGATGEERATAGRHLVHRMGDRARNDRLAYGHRHLFSTRPGKPRLRAARAHGQLRPGQSGQPHGQRGGLRQRRARSDGSSTLSSA